MLRTERLLLRRWTAADREPFAALNADPEVMRHFPGPLEREQTDGIAARIEAHFAQHGFGFWALEAEGRFIGFVGVQHVPFEAHFTPALEVGWRLARDAWGHGYASEAAQAALTYAFDTLGQREVVSFTVPANVRSRAVMERLGMQQDGEFEHPRFAPGHRLRRHVLYRLAKKS